MLSELDGKLNKVKVISIAFFFNPSRFFLELSMTKVLRKMGELFSLRGNNKHCLMIVTTRKQMRTKKNLQ